MNNLLDADIENEQFLTGDNSYWVKQKEALVKLNNKKWYKDLINEGYFKDYLAELASQLIDPANVREGKRNQIIERIVGVAKFKDYLDDVKALSSTEEAYSEDYQAEYVNYKNRVIALGEALDKAEKDKDFKVLVKDGYCTDLAVRQTGFVTNEQIIASGYRPDVFETLAGISTLTNYLIELNKKRAELVVDEEPMEYEDEV
jgi:hypothetical protein